jgi:hypothetical protein
MPPSLENKGLGARPQADQALAVPVEPASGLAPTGFDPSRVMEEFYLSPYYEPSAARPADNVQAAIEFVGDKWVRPLSQRVSDVARLACWAARRLPPKWEQFVTERLGRDSDEHRNGEDPQGLSGEAMPARAEGIAQGDPA